MTTLNNYEDIKNVEQVGFPGFKDTGYDLLLKTTQKQPQANALQFFSDGAHYLQAKKWTYLQFLEEINQTANLFHAYGLQQNEVISYLLPNLPETCFSFFGGEARGIVNPINPQLSDEHIADILNLAETKLLVTTEPQQEQGWDKLKAIIQQTPSLKAIFLISFRPNAPLSYPDINGVNILNFNAERQKQNKESLDFERHVSLNDYASFFHTGGTTGSPKLAMRTHFNELSNAHFTHLMLNANSKKTFLCGLPWFHANGVLVTGMMPLYHGHELILASMAGYRDPGLIQNFWAIVNHFKVTLFSAVPTLLKTLLSIPKGDSDLSSLEFAVCGAAPLSVKLFNDFEQATGIKLIEGYGFTEGVCVNSLNPPLGERKVGSIGLPMPFHQMKIAILDDQNQFLREAKTNESGIIVTKGINIMPAYKGEQVNAKAWVNIDGEQWYNTGDLGRQDEDGYFWITGRKKELIIRGGHNIDPSDIEEPISKHPAVAAVAAISRPDAHSGEVPVAYVELKPQQSASEEELLTHAAQTINERAAVPKKIYIIDQLPLTAVGKIFKPELENRQISEVYSEQLINIKGVKAVNVEVLQDPTHGKLAEISLKTTSEVDFKTIEITAKEALKLYTIKYQIKQA